MANDLPSGAEKITKRKPTLTAETPFHFATVPTFWTPARPRHERVAALGTQGILTDQSRAVIHKYSLLRNPNSIRFLPCAPQSRRPHFRCERAPKSILYTFQFINCDAAFGAQMHIFTINRIAASHAPRSKSTRIFMNASPHY